MLKSNQIVQNRFRVAARLHPFKDEVTTGKIPVGMSISDTVELMDTPPFLGAVMHARVNGDYVPHALWAKVKPKAGTFVTFSVVPAGTGQIISSILRVGAVIASFFPPYGTAVAAVLMAASAAVDIALPPESGVDIPVLISEPTPQSQTLAVTGTRNSAEIYGQEPRILGTHRAVPKLAATPVSETVGGNRWLRTIFALSFGPVAITDMKIGEASLDLFEGVETELRRGYLDWMINDMGGWSAATGAYPSSPSFGDRYTVDVAGTTAGTTYAVGDTITFNDLASAGTGTAWDLNQEKPLKLYPRDIFVEEFQIEVEKANGWIVRTSQIESDELAVDFVFPRGLIAFEATGSKRSVTVQFEIRYAPTGTQNWIKTFSYQKTGRATGVIYGGKRFVVDRSLGINGQFDVAVRRITNAHPGHSSEEIIADSNWTSLRTYTNEPPVDRPGMALLAVRIRPTDLARGVLDQFSCVLTSIGQEWDSSGQVWKWVPTSNPASLLRAVYQICDEFRRLPDSRMDLDRLQEWSEHCETNGFEANAYVDWGATVGEIATMLTAVGRAERWPRNGTQVSVVIDQPKTTPVQHFTPRNTWDYSADLIWPDQPDALRIAFPNKDENWRIDERLVFADGFDLSTAVDIQRSDIMMITDADQIYSQARYRMAILLRRRETHKFVADIEALVCEPMDWVKLTHDVIAVGLGSGRITGLTTDGTTITGVQFDEIFEVDPADKHTVQIRSATGPVLSFPVDELDPDGYGVTLREAVPVADGPLVGDLFSFGVTGQESLDVVVRSIVPERDNNVRVSVAPLAPEVHVADEELPPFTTSVSQPRTAPAPIVVSIDSGSRVMLVGPNNTLTPRVVFELVSPNVDDLTLRIFYRPSGTDQIFTEASVDTRTTDLVSVVGLETGETYDISLQYSHPILFASEVTLINSYQVVGRDDIPGPLQDLELSSVGGQALVRWARIPELDVQFGGWIVFRWSPVTSGAQWHESTVIGDFIAGSDQFAWLPLKAGTYLSRVFDSGARVSTVESVTTKQASVLAYVSVSTIQEDSTFSGTKVNCVVDSGDLTIALGDSWDDIADVDAVDNVDAVGTSVSLLGIYTFAAGYDNTTVGRLRLTSHIKAVILSIFDDIDGRTENIDNWSDFDGVDGAPADCAVFFRSTDDDPAGSPTWTGWTKLDSAEVDARGFEFKAHLTTTDAAYNIEVSELRVQIDELS